MVLIFLNRERVDVGKPVRMRAYPVIVLEMGTRHGHQVNRPSAPTNQTGRSRNVRVSSSTPHHTPLTLSCKNVKMGERLMGRYVHSFALRKTHFTSSSWFVKVSLFGKQKRVIYCTNDPTNTVDTFSGEGWAWALY